MSRTAGVLGMVACAVIAFLVGLSIMVDWPKVQVDEKEQTMTITVADPPEGVATVRIAFITADTALVFRFRRTVETLP